MQGQETQPKSSMDAGVGQRAGVVPPAQVRPRLWGGGTWCRS